MQPRRATLDDVPAAGELVRRADVFWFGDPEHDDSEVREFFDQVASLADDSLALVDDSDAGRLLALAMWTPTDHWFVIDPDRDDAIDPVIEWYQQRPAPKLHVLDRDATTRDRLDAHGFVHDSSMFDLLRVVDDGWTIAAPAWPDGVEVRDFHPDDTAAAYQLIYVDAAWTEVAGHPHREFDQWRSLFVTDQTVPALQAMAWRGPQLVGVAMGRTFSDGTGWIAQLAVAKAERGRGLGRALLLEGLRRHRAGGATQLGLGVQAENRNALALYLSVGLRIDREWMEYVPRG